MQAAVVRETGGPEVLTLEDVEAPVPSPGQVLLETRACGVGFHDVVVRNGTLKRGVKLPLIPGHEIAGVVAGLGPGVHGWQLGDRVATTQWHGVCGRCRYCRSGHETLCDDWTFIGDAGLNGGYAENVVVDAYNLVEVASHVSMARACIMSCAIGTVLGAIREGRVQAGDRVLVTGASGGLGVHAVQLARLCGAVVLAETTSPDSADLLRQNGADVVIPVQRGEDFSSRVRELTDGHGADVVIDCVGTPTFHAARRSLARRGRWVFVGELTGDFVRLNPAQIFFQSISIHSIKSTTRHVLEDVVDLVERGRIRPVVTRKVPLSRVREAHEEIERGKVTGRLVLTLGEESSEGEENG